MDKPSEITERLNEAIGKVRIDEYKPFRYLFYIFLAGIARGLGFALGMTVILAVVLIISTKIIGAMVNFPLIGHHVKSLVDLVQEYLKSGIQVK